MNEIIDKTKYTPMMRQYLTIKEHYPDTIVLYRVGDFYETFFNDAKICSKELELVLTKKNVGIKNEPAPMAGVPYHAIDNYIEKLSEKGYRIAIVDQMDEPSSKKLVDREVTKIVTPGTNIDTNYLNEKSNNFIAALTKKNDKFILSYIDISTGDAFIEDFPLINNLIYNEIKKLQIKEIIVGNLVPKSVVEFISNSLNILISKSKPNELDNYMEKLYQELNIDEKENAIQLLNYIASTQRRSLVHLKPFRKIIANEFLKLDYNTIYNLELISSIKNNNQANSLFNILDKCSTAMGSRHLKRSIIYPLTDVKKIEYRLDIISELLKSFLYLDDLKQNLNEIYDLERIIGRISYDNLTPKDLLQLKNSLKVLPNIKAVLKKTKEKNLVNYASKLLEFADLYKLIDAAIKEDAPFIIRDGGFIKDGYSKELDEIKNINKENKAYLLELEAKEKERTGIKTLRVQYNRVFGYYIEVSKGAINQIKDEFGYIRKQTTVNSERFITQELKEKETQILNAKENAIELEFKLFEEIKDICKLNLNDIQVTATLISELDMLLSLALTAKENNYVRPNFNIYGEVEIIGGRHPVVEVNMNEEFIPNDWKMNKMENLILITGPNMGGKSTYMRQNALIVILAQMGSFVPAEKCNLPIFDQIFTRIGASDNIASGESTFMVEMNEVNFALKNATYNSLILFDEVGRGTATYDGMALAQAIIEYLVNNVCCKTLFSTHYHELTSLDSKINNLKNIHLDAIEDNGNLIFMHKVKNGSIDKSFGVHVAKIAKLPDEIIYRASDLLQKITSSNKIDNELLSIDNYQKPIIIDKRNEKETKVINDLKNVKVDDLKPIDALLYLQKLQEQLGDNDE